MLVSTCPGCGLTASRPTNQVLVPAPERHTASDACWSLYGELLSRSYTDADYRRVHQLVVDTYTAQHAGPTGRRAVQLVGLCLMTLCLIVEDGVDPVEGPALHRRMMDRRPDLSWLTPPRQHDLMTVADVLTAQDAAQHQRLVGEWARQVWEAWTEHHATIRAWNAYALGPAN
ncbi:hypothetical protein E8P82_13685 [Arthrobacter echini]|uniref:Uncharacterized protein n=1 Tax=Arthrobacter echini TaxID=1529066 RepID=A0A4S5E0U4_9MICC|nr:DUF5946 family protein [Arthrobacter echini]THJ64936.1 hypothetical protein E8P82_13685 [Arthrobacter echini]